MHHRTCFISCGGKQIDAVERGVWPVQRGIEDAFITNAMRAAEPSD